MSFLQAALFWSLAPLLFSPLLIHLLSRRLTRPLHFPSVRHLKVSLTRSAAIYRWRHWLFLLLRTLLLLMLLLAFLLPTLLRQGTAQPEQLRTIFVVVDSSLSMEHVSGGQTARERAMHEAERILDTLRPGDRVNIVHVDTEVSTAFPAMGEDIAAARSYMGQLKPGTGSADISQANHLIAGMASQTESTNTEVYYLSDFQRSDWANVNFRPLPPSARIFFINVGAEDRNNRALNSLAIEGELIAGGLVKVEIGLANFAANDTEESIQLLLDGRPVGTASLYVAPYSIAKTEIPIVLPSVGKHLLQAQIGRDSLNEDNSIYGVIKVREKQEVLLLTGNTTETNQSIRYLEAALNPFIGGDGSIRPRQLDIAEASPAEFAAVSKVFICQAGAFAESTVKQLAQFIFSGGGVVWFLDSQDDAAMLRELGGLLGDGGASLELGAWYATESISHARQVMGGDFRSPFLKLFSGTNLQDLGRLEIYENFSAAFTGTGKKLLTYADGSPAMTEQTHGTGQLVLINFSPDTRYSNLAKERFFPVWMQTLIHAFDTELAEPLYLNVGQRVTTNLWKNDISQRRFSDPDGETVETRVEVIGQRANVSFPALKAGIYQLNAGDRLVAAFAVNHPAGEADLRPVPMEDLPARDGTPEQAILLEGSRTDFHAAVFGYPLFPWFIAAALFCAVAEIALHLIVHRNRPVVSGK